MNIKVNWDKRQNEWGIKGCLEGDGCWWKGIKDGGVLKNVVGDELFLCPFFQSDPHSASFIHST